MAQTITDWEKYVNGEVKFETSDFHFLFKNDTSDPSLQRIFGSFPHSDELIRRLKAVLNPKPSDDQDPGRWIELARQDLFQKREICQENDEPDLVEYLELADYEITTDRDQFSELKRTRWPHGLFLDTVDDFLLDFWLDDSEKYFALFEAYQALVENLNLVWYLGGPLIDSEFNLDLYYDLWAAGGDYALGKDHIHVMTR